MITISLLCSSLAHAELLIIKQDENGFAPLEDEDIDESDKIITDIVLKYQWPMCITSSLTKQEIDLLLTSGMEMRKKNL